MVFGWFLWSAVASPGVFDPEMPCTVQRPPQAPVEVYLVTVSPGPQAFSFVGHAGFWIRDPRNGIDHIVEFGAINSRLQEPVSALVLGDLRCWWRVSSIRQNQRDWYDAERRAIAQKLSLPPEAMRALLEIVYDAADHREERSFVFHWRDRSCATELRDVLDQALSGGLKAALDVPAPLTARQEVLRHLQPHLWAWVGWHHQVGAVADLPQTRWQAAFAPVRLAEALDDFEVRWPDGETRPIVEQTCSLSQSGSPWPAAAPPRTGWLAAIGALLGGAIVGAHRAERHRVVGGLAILIGVLGGLLGTANLIFFAISDLEVYGPNRNWLLTSPLTLGLIACGVAWWRGARPQWAAILAAVLAVLAGLSLVLYPVPIYAQQMLGFVGLMLPVLAAFAWAGRRR